MERSKSNKKTTKKYTVLLLFAIIYPLIYGYEITQFKANVEEYNNVFELISLTMQKKEIGTIYLEASITSFSSFLPESFELNDSLLSAFRVYGWISTDHKKSILDTGIKFNFFVKIYNIHHDLTPLEFEGYVKDQTVYFRNLRNNSLGYAIEILDSTYIVNALQKINITCIEASKKEAKYVIESLLPDQYTENSVQTNQNECFVTYEKKSKKVKEINEQNLVLLDETNWWSIFTLVDF